MKFAAKLTLAVLVLFNLCAGIISSILLQQNFDAMLTANCGQYVRMQVSLCRAMQEAVETLPEPRTTAQRNTALRKTVENAGAYLGWQYARVYIRQQDGTAVYKSLPQGVSEADAAAALDADHGIHPIYAVEETRYAGFCTRMEADGVGYQVFSVYDVTDVFMTRNAQQRSVLVLTLVLLPLSAVVVWGTCTLLTRNIRKLENTAAAIAGGAYENRSGIAGSDEIAALSKSFDHMADTVERTIGTLEENLRQREEFVAAFTHEIKTPMTTMIGYSDLLRSQSCDADTVHLAAGYIHSETSRLAALSQNLLMLLGLSREQVQLQPVLLEPVLEQLRTSLRVLPGGAVLLVEGDTDCTVLTQSDLLLVLLRNLVQNAARAKPKDGCVRLDCTMCTAEKCLHIAVRDTGCGIPPQDLPHVTQAFYMVDKSRARSGGGSGIGLALCERIAALHGSAMRIESAVGEGTSVYFALPLIENETEYPKGGGDQ